jgi:hypothetical protein
LPFKPLRSSDRCFEEYLSHLVLAVPSIVLAEIYTLLSFSLSAMA